MKIWKWFKKGMKVLSNWKWETVETLKKEWGFISKNWVEFNLWDIVNWYKAK